MDKLTRSFGRKSSVALTPQILCPEDYTALQALERQPIAGIRAMANLFYGSGPWFVMMRGAF